MSPNFHHRLQSVVARSSPQLKTLTAHLSRLLASTSGVDVTLSTFYYTLALLHSSLTSILIRKYEKLAHSITAKASQTMSPGEIAAIDPPHLALTEVCMSVKAAGDAINDTRTLLRLWNLVNLSLWAKDSISNPSRDPIIKLLVLAQVGANVAFQTLENGAFLIRKGILGGQRLTSMEQSMWVWSGRFWLSHVVLEILRLGRVRQLRFRKDLGAQKLEDAEPKQIEVMNDLEASWHRNLYASLGWIPPSLLFSSTSEDLHSPAREAIVAASGMVPSVLALQDAWQATA